MIRSWYVRYRDTGKRKAEYDHKPEDLDHSDRPIDSWRKSPGERVSADVTHTMQATSELLVSVEGTC